MFQGFVSSTGITSWNSTDSVELTIITTMNENENSNHPKQSDTKTTLYNN